MTDIQQIANDKIHSMIAENTISKMIEDNVQSAIEKAIAAQFQSYGSITKQIEKAIEDGLSLNIKDLPFEIYNQQILVAIKGKLGNFFAESATNKFMEEIDKTLAPAPQEMSINDFVETIVSMWKTDDYHDNDELDEFATVKLEEPHWSSNKTCYSLEIWKQKESNYSHRLNDADINIFINNGKVRINHNHSYNPTYFNETEAFIFKAYAAGTTITGLEYFDEDNCDLTLKSFDY